MSTALTTHNLTEEQVNLIKTQIAVGCTNDELKLFMYTCNRTGLDPMARQIYAIKRNTKKGPVMTIQTGIDGYRLVADRTGKYAGSDEPVFLPEGNDRKAVVTVYKMVGGVRCPFVGVAYWSEYKPKNGGGMWEDKPRTMLAKCAEALALRKGFPNELSGLYTKEEMDQAGDGDVPIATVSIATAVLPVSASSTKQEDPLPPAEDFFYESDVAPPPMPVPETKTEQAPVSGGPKHISAAQLKRFYAIKAKSGLPDENVRQILRKIGKVENVIDLHWKEYKDVCEALEFGLTKIDDGPAPGDAGFPIPF